MFGAVGCIVHTNSKFFYRTFEWPTYQVFDSDEFERPLAFDYQFR